jgi:hypothetical protein
MATAPDKILDMSDEDILNMAAPPAVEAAPADPAGSGSDPAPSGAEPAPKDPADADPAPAGGDDPKPGEPGTGAADPSDEEIEGQDPPAADKGKEGGEAAPTNKDEPKPDATSGGGEPAPAAVELSVDDKAGLFDQIMKPFKANGKTIELRSPEEAIQLMQMGANYTKKLQDLQPHRKVLMMLESNGLLDEGKLSYLIDIDRKDPAAIQKLLKDSGINPLEIDADADPAYVEGSHRISDAEANFRTTLDELSSNPMGSETLKAINTTWDEASKQALWQSPEIMTVIHQQREAGVYDVIATEVDRQRTLGHIPANTPFLEAYKTVGDAMAQAAIEAAGGTGGQPTGATGSSTAQPQVLATKTAAPKSQVTNGDQASAASPTRSSSKTAEVKPNPLAMSDEEFLKSMENRL